jgi:hypothetical protein
MIFDKETIKIILGIKDNASLTPREMADDLVVTFFPYKKEDNSVVVNDFAEKLEAALLNLGIKVIRYEDALINVNFLKRFGQIFKIILVNFRILLNGGGDFFKIKLGKKIMPGVAIFMIGNGKDGDLPMDNTTSFKYNPIITIIDKPLGINSDSTFYDHMNAALDLFAHNMSNLLISVTSKDFTIYSFNASYPNYLIDDTFDSVILRDLIPKIAAPVRPPKFHDFQVRYNSFEPLDEKYFIFIDDIIKSGPILEKTGLYPKGKKIEDLKFRNNFYKWVGSLHLDKRNGMSYGFLARQLPVNLSIVLLEDKLPQYLKSCVSRDKKYFYHKDELYVRFSLFNKRYVILVPDVWVLTSRSGSDKTKLDVQRDIIKIGLVSGRMILELPQGKKNLDFKPSFDTRVILSHAVSNAIFASILNYFQPNNNFAKLLVSNGLALAHWHGYINPGLLKEKWNIYGFDNPSVSCSSSQSALYAFIGKETGVMDSLLKKYQYIGDIHIEPQHGTNMTFDSLVSLANFLSDNKGISKLGNEYFNFYKN